MPRRVDNGAGLPHRVTEGNVRFVCEFFCKAVAVQDLPLGKRHFNIPGGPIPGGKQSLPGPGFLRVCFFQSGNGLLRQLQRPQYRGTVIGALQKRFQIV